jgi:hypothetical protein
MDWYYAENDARKGPISENEIRRLVSSGNIQPATLVWNSAMTAWQEAAATPLFPAASQPPPAPKLPGHHICIITGKPFPESQMIKTEHGWVSAEGKDHYYQALREGAPIPVADGQTNARADGKYVVIPVSGGKLPLRCVKTNQPVTDDRAPSKTLYWCTPWVFLALLANILILAILYFVLRKKVIVDIPLSVEGQRIVTRHKTIAWLSFFLGLGLLFWGITIVNTSDEGPIFMIAGFLLMLGSLVYGGRKAQALRVAKLRNGQAWLVGATPAFVGSLPKYL